MGISGASIASGSINQGRLSTSTGSTSGTITAGAIVQWAYSSDYTMYFAVVSSSSLQWPLAMLAPEGSNAVAFKNTQGVSYNYSITARKIST
jgi:hypothetical protein